MPNRDASPLAYAFDQSLKYESPHGLGDDAGIMAILGRNLVPVN